MKIYMGMYVKHFELSKDFINNEDGLVLVEDEGK